MVEHHIQQPFQSYTIFSCKSSGRCCSRCSNPPTLPLTKGPPLGGTAANFPFTLCFFSEPQTLNSNAFFCIQLQEFYKSEPTFFATPHRAPGGTAAMFSPYVLFLFLNPKPYTSMHSFAFNFKILETNQNSHFFHTRNMFPLVFLVFFTNLNFKAQPKLPCFHLYSFCIFPVHSFVFNFNHFTNQNLHFFTPLRPPPLGGTAALFLPLIFWPFCKPQT